MVPHSWLGFTEVKACGSAGWRRLHRHKVKNRELAVGRSHRAFERLAMDRIATIHRRGMQWDDVTIRARSVLVSITVQSSEGFMHYPRPQSAPTRRTALERVALAVAGFFGLGLAAKGQEVRRPALPARKKPVQFPPPPTLVELTAEQLRSAWDDLADPA